MNSNFTVVGLIIGVLLLTGCETTIDQYAGDRVSASETGRIKNSAHGTIVKVDYVRIDNNKNKVGTAGAAVGGAVIGGLIGNAIGGPKGALWGAGLGGAGGGAAGYAATRNKKYDRVPSYTVRLDNGNDIVIVQGGNTVFSIGQSVQVVYDNSGRGRIVPA